MATVSYTSPDATWVFRFPTITVTQTMVPSAFGYARMSTRYVYTLRSILIADDATDLEAKKQAARDVLGYVGGIFKWEEDGPVTVVEWTPQKDANFGPHPTQLVFEKFYGVHSAVMIWQIEVEEAAVDTLLLDMVYTTSHSLDKNFYTVRTTAGMMRLNGAKFDPASFGGSDSYRNTIENYICACPAGWQRVGRNFEMSTDGLTLTFAVTDEQRFAVLPDNITDGEASLSIEGDPKLGNKQDFTLEGWFEAPPDKQRAPREAFSQLAASLFNFSTSNEAFRVKFMGLRQDLYRCRLSYRMVWDAWSPDPLTGSIPGANETERRSNWMLQLLTKADDWLDRFKGTLATDRGAYGTTNVRGWCGSSELAPVITPSDYQTLRAKTGLGNDSLATLGNGDAIVTDGEPAYFYEFKQKYSYSIDNGIVVIPYKDTDKDDEVQQVRPISVYLKVEGKISSKNVTGIIPEPPYTKDAAILLQSNIWTEEPLDGPVYTIRWRYLLKLKAHGTPEKLKIPFSPFVPNTEFDNQDEAPWPTKSYDNYKFINDLTATDTGTGTP